MNAPQEFQRSVDDDPTGMRALLRELPDPGPMPDALVARIQASLAEEARTGGTGVNLGSFRATRRPGLRPIHWAAAGLVAVAGGGLLLSNGGTGLMSAFTSGGSHSAASMAERGAADTAGGAAQAPAPAAGPTDGPVSGGMLPAGSVHVIATEGVWSGTDLTGPAGVALTNTGDELRDLASESPAIGPIGTAIGGRDCATALGVAADASVLIDLVTHDGTRAALVVVTTPGGEQTAYVVGRHCRLGDPELRVGPQRLHF